jgi:predicted TIM-barrel fold metal-dependent hydrolase
VQLIDGQLHTLEKESIRRPWPNDVVDDFEVRQRIYAAFAHRVVTTPQLLEMLDQEGIWGALIVTPSIYGEDNRYSLEAYMLAPKRIRVIGLINPFAPDSADRLTQWKRNRGVVGARILAITPTIRGRLLGDPCANRALTAAAKTNTPLCIATGGSPELVVDLAVRFPDLKVVVDHMALPTWDDASGAAFSILPRLLKLSAFENVVIKLTGLPGRSITPYPHRDLWDPIKRVIDSFGIERLIWASDATMHDYPYRNDIGYLLTVPFLSGADKALVMGGNLRRVFGWPESDPESRD